MQRACRAGCLLDFCECVCVWGGGGAAWLSMWSCMGELGPYGSACCPGALDQSSTAALSALIHACYLLLAALPFLRRQRQRRRRRTRRQRLQRVTMSDDALSVLRCGGQRPHANRHLAYIASQGRPRVQVPMKWGREQRCNIACSCIPCQRVGAVLLSRSCCLSVASGCYLHMLQRGGPCTAPRKALRLLPPGRTLFGCESPHLSS